MAQLKTFLRFVKERESIRLKKEAAQPAPWTKDKILQKYRFCNIRRSDDRVSRWLIQNILTEANLKAGLQNFLEVTAWCRWINWPPTIQKVIEAGLISAEQINWTAVGRFVDRIPGKKWTGAYMIAAPRQSKQKKGLFVAQQVIQTSFRHGVLPDLERLFEMHYPDTTAEMVWGILIKRMYFGKFMAGQIVGDWGYTSLLRNAEDRFQWAPIGPGSKRGFNRLVNRPIKTKIDPNEWRQGLWRLRDRVINHLGNNYETLTALDVQNQLCEFDKYLRVKNGEGRPRANYRPETAYDV